mmetsp:Transcript_7354/g.8441  ORF Transcript_7354/g.8441 Transcript_7354/m.8441 type:complete len:291 (-) Transcript_7354:1399-2271(-)
MDLRLLRHSMTRSFQTQPLRPKEVILVDNVDAISILKASAEKCAIKKAPSRMKGLKKSLPDPTKVYGKLLSRTNSQSGKLRARQEETKQFGVGTNGNSLVRVQLHRYASPIPAVLVALKQQLMDMNGLKMEGIFRITPNAEKMKLYRDQLDKGQFISCDANDRMCMAGLIKEWFRSLPKPLIQDLELNSIRSVAKASASDETVIPQLLSQIQEPNNSILSWFLDLLVMVAQYEKNNKMTLKNLAIVVAPNLYDIQGELPPPLMMGAIDALVETVHRMLRYRNSIQPNLRV